MIRPASFALSIAAAGILVAGQVVFAQTTDQGTTSSQSSSSSQSSTTDQGTTTGKHHKNRGANASMDQTGTSGTLSASDKTFATKAAEGSIAEIKFASLAEQKTDDQQIKNFAHKLTEDHTKALDEIKSIAQKKGITLPDSMNAKDQAEYDRLSKLSGDQFDKAYTRFMERDHHKDIAEFRREAEKGQDPDLKSYAANTVPTLESHLRMAEANARREGANTNANADGTRSRRNQTNTDNTGMGNTGTNPNNPNNTNPNYPNNPNNPNNTPNSTTRPRP